MRRVKTFPALNLFLLTALLLIACGPKTPVNPANLPPTSPTAPTLTSEFTQNPTPTTPAGPLTPAETSPPVTTTTPTSPPITPTTTSPAPVFAWVYQGERQGVVDATTFVLPDGTYRQFYGSTLLDGGIAAATSKDGISWTEEGRAGVPVGGRVVRTANGRYRLYGGQNKKLRVFTSVDGKAWQEEPEGSIKAPDPGGLSCDYASGDVAIMPDGTYRMFYERRDASQFFPDGGVSTIVSATSPDGLIWQNDNAWQSDFFVAAETIAGAFHPRVIKLPNGTYKMFYWSDNAVLSAISRDGRSWTDRKYENVFGGDPDILLLPDGRIVMFVNWRDLTLPRNNLAVQRMWTYVWQQVPFAFGPFDPVWNALRPGETILRSLPITGIPGTNVRLTATVYSNKGVTPVDNPASPLTGSITTTPDAVQLSVTARVDPPASGYVVIVADDGAIRVSTSLRFIISTVPQPPK